jgi:hypothetical protein
MVGKHYSNLNQWWVRNTSYIMEQMLVEPINHNISPSQLDASLVERAVLGPFRRT